MAIFGDNGNGALRILGHDAAFVMEKGGVLPAMSGRRCCKCCRHRLPSGENCSKLSGVMSARTIFRPRRHGVHGF